MSQRLKLQAYTLTFIDEFHLLAWSCVAALLLVTLLKKSPMGYGDLSAVEQPLAPEEAKA